MMLALQLDRLGVPSVILNTETEPRCYPKGSTHNARTMEHFRNLGISAQLRQSGLPSEHPTDVAYCTRWSQWELARIRMPSEQEKAQQVARALPTDQLVEPILRCNQMYVERMLFEHLRTRQSVDVRFGWRCDDWTETCDGVSATATRIGDGRSETLECDYLVGCDGAQSMSRRKLGIRLGGDSTENQAYLGGTMLTAHVRSASLFDEIPHPRAWQYWTVTKAIRSNIVSLNGTDEFIYQTQIADHEQPSEELARRRLVKSMGKAFDFEILGISTWRPGLALVADRYQSTRVLLCGDAVHLFTPTGGFGLNTGVDDAVNLAWKLAGVVQGWGGAKLLSTYETERRPIGIRNTTMAKALTRNVGKVPVAAEVEDDTRQGAVARVELGKFLSQFTEEYASIGIQLGARYDNSPIIVQDGCHAPPDDPAKYVPSGCPGGRTPHVWLPDQTSLFDHLGVGFSVLSLEATDVAPLALAARVRGLPLKSIHINVDGARELYGAALALVRPDHILCWRGDRLPGDCHALLGQVTGF